MKETLEEVAERLHPNNCFEDDLYCDEGKYFREAWLEGAKWQQERSYSEDDMREAFEWGVAHVTFEEWIKKFKKI